MTSTQMIKIITFIVQQHPEDKNRNFIHIYNKHPNDKNKNFNQNSSKLRYELNSLESLVNMHKLRNTEQHYTLSKDVIELKQVSSSSLPFYLEIQNLIFRYVRTVERNNNAKTMAIQETYKNNAKTVAIQETLLVTSKFKIFFLKMLDFTHSYLISH